MLGRLARWLRFAGFDVLFAAGAPDDWLADTARAEGRWLLTRDRLLAARAGPRVLLLRTGSLDGQVSEVRSRLVLPVEPERFFTRCSECNGLLRPAPRDEVETLVPPFVAVHAPAFKRCASCGRIYWPGSHAGCIAARLDELFVTELRAPRRGPSRPRRGPR